MLQKASSVEMLGRNQSFYLQSKVSTLQSKESLSTLKKIKNQSIILMFINSRLSSLFTKCGWDLVEKRYCSHAVKIQQTQRAKLLWLCFLLRFKELGF